MISDCSFAHTEELFHPLLSPLFSLCSRHNEMSLFQIAPLNYTSCLNMEQTLLFLDEPAPWGPGRHRRPLILTAREAAVTLSGWFIAIRRDPGDPAAVTSQSADCLTPDLVAVKGNLMHYDETVADIHLWSINILTHSLWRSVWVKRCSKKHQRPPLNQRRVLCKYVASLFFMLITPHSAWMLKCH